MKGFEIGKRYSVRTERSGEPVVVTGTLETVLGQPWGTDAEVRLDEPQPIGHQTYNLPVDRLSVSLTSLGDA